VANADLSGKRILLLGAETDLGGAIAAALAEAGARVALVGAANDSETAFAVQRLARKVGAEVSQAIDATNEMAVRVMVRQVSKALGGLDAIVSCTAADESKWLGTGLQLLMKPGIREMDKRGRIGRFIVLVPVWRSSPPRAAPASGYSLTRRPPTQSPITPVPVADRAPDDVANDVVAILAGAPE
jgi:NAD(P)-dependent dehydrogenase (short-subunit alcohol dehydrogenase family)